MKKKSIMATVLTDRNFWLALLIMTTANIGNACVRQPVTLLGSNLGLAASALGVITSLYTIIAMLGRGPFGNAVDAARGKRKTWVLGGQYAVRGIVFIGFALCGNVPMFVLLKFAQGLTFGMGHIAMMVVLAETMDKRALGSAFGLITLIPKLLSSVTNTITLNITNTFGVEYSCYAGAILSFIPAVLCLLLVMPDRENAPAKTKAKFSLKTFVNYRAIPLVLIMTFVSVPSLFVDNFMVLFGQSANMADQAGSYISDYMWWMGIGAFVAGYLFDRFGFKGNAIIIAAMALIAQIMMAFSLNPTVWFISSILCGLAAGGIASVTRGYAVNESPKAVAALTVATLGVMQDLATLVGSSIGGVLADTVGYITTFKLIAICPAVALIMLLFFLPKLVAILKGGAAVEAPKA